MSNQNFAHYYVVKIYPDFKTRDTSATRRSCEPWQVDWKGNMSVTCAVKEYKGSSGEFFE